VTSTPESVGDQLTVTIPTTSASQFFRLRQQ
jgi:hypothetical protein